MKNLSDANFTNSQDALQMYFGYDYKINDNIILKQPRIKDINKIGEEKYYGMISNLTTIPSDAKALLFDINVDYMETSNLQMFAMIAPALAKDDYSIIFGDLDFSKFEMYERQNGDLVFYNSNDDIVIDDYIHRLIANYLCKLHGIKKKVEFAANKYTKQILIEEERTKRKANANKIFESQLLPQISFLENSAGSKYNKEQILEMNIFHFTDCITRLSWINSVAYLANGYYNGNIDPKKFDIKKLNCMKNLYTDKD